MSRLVLWVLGFLMLASAMARAHGPEVAAVVVYTLSGQVTLRLIDTYGATVTGRLTAQFPSGAPSRSKPITLLEDSEGVYRFNLRALGAQSQEIAIEAILWNEVYRTNIEIDPARAGQEVLFGLQEYPQAHRAGLGLAVYGGLTLGLICLLGILLVRRPPA